jgi:hypothetical protein
MKNEELRMKNVEVRIYDINGKLLSSTFNNHHSSFSLKTNWDASSQPPGIYVFKIKIDQKILVKKATLVK